MKNNLTTVTVTILATIFVASSCKKVNKKSNLESVDNFSNTSVASFSLNSCTPQNDKNMYSESPAEHANLVDKWLGESSHFVISASTSFEDVRDDLKQVLLSTPVYISQYFFASGAKIYIENDSPSLCQEYQDAGGDEVGVTKMFACWFHKGEGKENGISLGAGSTTKEEIDVKKSIRHGMLRAMAYYYFSTILQNGSEIDTETKNLLEGLKSSEPSAIGSQMVKAVEADLGKQFPRSIPQDVLRLNLYVETIDSIYCSAKTHSIMKTRFPKLLEAFKTGKGPN